jgi:hypothetical protein
MYGRTPRDLGFVRSRWSCVLLTLLLFERRGVRLSPEAVRRGLHDIGFVWRRPRPVVGLKDPEHDAKLRMIQRLLGHLPADETAVFQDEVDVDLNPKIGSCWMERGRQAEVVSPGNNEKVHLAGSLHWRTGRLLFSAPGRRRNAVLSVAHLDDLCRDSAATGPFTSSATTPPSTTAAPSANASSATAGGSSCTSCRSTRPRPIRSNASGGISTRTSPATTAAGRSTNSSHNRSSGSTTIASSSGKPPTTTTYTHSPDSATMRRRSYLGASHVQPNDERRGLPLRCSIRPAGLLLCVGIHGLQIGGPSPASRPRRIKSVRERGGRPPTRRS